MHHTCERAEFSLDRGLADVLRAWARGVVEAELVRMRRRVPGLDEQAVAEAAATLQRVVGTLLDEPILRARELSAGSGGGRHLEALARLYGVDDTGGVKV